MIEIHKTATDDPGFLSLVTNLIGNLEQNRTIHELHVVHIDNWFDHKWLGFSGKILGVAGVWKTGDRLTIPAFKPSRVHSHQYFVRADPNEPLEESNPPRELHMDVWSPHNLQRRYSEVAGRGAVVWYTSNTRSNAKGAVMVYTPRSGGIHHWYASMSRGSEWAIDKVKEISRSEAEQFLSGLRSGASSDCQGPKSSS